MAPGGEAHMLGIDDPWIILGYALSIGCTVIAVLYGWWKWNEEVD
ncbi:MAG: hypothetical protein A4E29_00999 [Methanomassiliicoccales archaeon PtaB.Bin134]|jgi:hypothetical protein|nr:MAG: hypothetical protein A4E29_00999 [Methanomassiliicoccales archaeon PtaB.Bin134]